MELKKVFEEVMQQSINMALATSVDGQPNVRVVTFAYDPDQPKAVYFTTFRGCKKIEEFMKNPRVACVMLPNTLNADAQVRIFGKVQPSSASFEHVVAMIGKKWKESAEMLTPVKEMIEVYEINFQSAEVTVGMTPPQLLML